MAREGINFLRDVNVCFDLAVRVWRFSNFFIRSSSVVGDVEVSIWYRFVAAIEVMLDPMELAVTITVIFRVLAVFDPVDAQLDAIVKR
jgi:hypothetical protein